MNKKKFWLRKISTVTARTFTAKLIVAVIEGTCIFHLSFLTLAKPVFISVIVNKIDTKSGVSFVFVFGCKYAKYTKHKNILG